MTSFAFYVVARDPSLSPNNNKIFFLFRITIPVKIICNLSIRNCEIIVTFIYILTNESERKQLQYTHQFIGPWELPIKFHEKTGDVWTRWERTYSERLKSAHGRSKQKTATSIAIQPKIVGIGKSWHRSLSYLDNKLVHHHTADFSQNKAQNNFYQY